jgi:hypothetical protein
LLFGAIKILGESFNNAICSLIFFEIIASAEFPISVKSIPIFIVIDSLSTNHVLPLSISSEKKESTKSVNRTPTPATPILLSLSLIIVFIYA